MTASHLPTSVESAMSANAQSWTRQGQAQDQTRREDSGARQMFASIVDDEAAAEQLVGGEGVTPGPEAARERSATLLRQAQDRVEKACGGSHALILGL